VCDCDCAAVHVAACCSVCVVVFMLKRVTATKCVLRCVARVLHCVALCCSVCSKQSTASENMLQCVAVLQSVLQCCKCVTVLQLCCSVLQSVAACVM